MYSLPKEIHREILSWLEPEERQVTRLTDRYFAGLIQPQDTNLLVFGAKHGVLEYCEIGLSRGNSKQQICEIAAGNGHLKVLQWARSQGCPWDSDTCSEAARNGHLEVLRWARKYGCPWDEDTCSLAAINGHLEVLKWARANGCPWVSTTCSFAAGHGHLEILIWARSQKCPWCEETCTYAADNGHLEVLKYAIENGCPWDFRVADISGFPQHIQDYLMVLHG